MRLIPFIACLVALAGRSVCAGAKELPPQPEKDAHQIYINKCAKCHELYDPRKYSDPEWDKWMLKMKRKSKLKDEQFELVLRYTTEIRTSARPMDHKER